MGEDRQPAPVYRLYSRRHVELATFFGSPIAGALLIRANFRRLGNPRAGRQVVLLAAVGAAAVIAGAVFSVASGMPRRALPLFYELSFLSGVFILFERSMQSLVKAHVSAGGRTGPWRRALGAAAAGLPIFFVIYAALMMVLRLGPTWILDRWTDCVTATRSISLRFPPESRESVCFTNGATENDARELGDELRKRHVFRGGRHADVWIERSSGRHVISFPSTDRPDFESEDHARDLAVTGEEMATTYRRQPFELRLCYFRRSRCKTVFLSR
jgi:hypothetical protein